MIPSLETARTVLRGHTLDDFNASAAMWADENVVRYITGRPSTQEESWSRLLRYIGHWQLLGFGYWVVEDKVSGLFLGEVGFADYHRHIEPSLDGKPEAGWAFARAAHGKGLATEAVLRIVEWSDTHLPNKVTSCVVAPEHTASLNVAQKAGYRKVTTATYMNAPTIVMERTRAKKNGQTTAGTPA